VLKDYPAQISARHVIGRQRDIFAAGAQRLFIIDTFVMLAR